MTRGNANTAPTLRPRIDNQLILVLNCHTALPWTSVAVIAEFSSEENSMRVQTPAHAGGRSAEVVSVRAAAWQWSAVPAGHDSAVERHIPDEEPPVVQERLRGAEAECPPLSGPPHARVGEGASNSGRPSGWVMITTNPNAVIITHRGRAHRAGNRVIYSAAKKSVRCSVMIERTAGLLNDGVPSAGWAP